MCDFGFGDFGGLACGGQPCEQFDDVVKPQARLSRDGRAKCACIRQNGPDSLVGAARELDHLAAGCGAGKSDGAQNLFARGKFKVH